MTFLGAVAITPRPVPVEPPRPAPPPRGRWRRRLALAAMTLGVLLMVTALVFPTDEIVRAAVARVTPASGPFLVFEHAVLRPWGLRLDHAALRSADGSVLAHVDWIRVRPSFWGLLRDGTGRPWQVASMLCGGRIDATANGGNGSGALDATWTDVDLGACVPSIGQVSVTGRTTGHAVVQTAPGGRPTGAGDVHVRDGVWQRDDPVTDRVDVLHVDAAGTRWSFEAGILKLDDLELRGSDLELRGGGTIRPAGTASASALDLALVVAPGPDASEDIRNFLDRLPAAPGDDPTARALVVKGTAGLPQIPLRPKS